MSPGHVTPERVRPPPHQGPLLHRNSFVEHEPYRALTCLFVPDAIVLIVLFDDNDKVVRKNLVLLHRPTLREMINVWVIKIRDIIGL